LQVGIGLLFLLVLIAGLVLIFHWPFRQAAIIKDLEDAASGKVEIKSFREIYFPYPGCIVGGMTYRLSPNASPFVTVEKLTIQSNPIALFVGHVRKVQIDGMHIFVPVAGSPENFKGLKAGGASIDEISVENAILDVPQKEPGKPPVEFAIHHLDLDPVTASRTAHFSAKLSNPEPPGEISVSGRLGPWKGAQTPLSGDYKFENADLGSFQGIAGMLYAEGSFNGALQNIDVSGKINIPGFEVTASQHPVPLNSEFKAHVNGVNGDTFLDAVSSQFLNTSVISRGKIAGAPGQRGKTATIFLEENKGRIEDILRLFVQSARPPMKGEVSFKGQAKLPPGKTPFLKKIVLEGDFGINDSSFTSQATQQKVDQLSQIAQTDQRQSKKLIENKKAEDKNDGDSSAAPPVVSGLQGHVVVNEGTATFSSLSFSIPGAHVQMHGTYSLISDKIDLHGTLKMDSQLSDAAHGTKAAVLKVLNPFFKRKHGGSDVPVKISGDYHHPSFGLDVKNAGKDVLSGKK
jgi:hypothetical protein